MNIMNSLETTTPARQAAVNGLAAVGFIALVVAGIWLAVSSTRFVPGVIERLGAAAVYLGSVFTPPSKPGLAVVPSGNTASTTTTISFGNATSTAATSTPAAAPVKPVAPTPGPTTTTVVQVEGGAATPATLFGLPDLMVTITVIGYLETASADSFIASATVPSGKRPALKFTIKNVGTNVSGSWRFSADIPTRRSFTYNSPAQPSINPGDSIDYTLGFDQASRGTNQTITINVDPNNQVDESTNTNNTASADVTVR